MNEPIHDDAAEMGLLGSCYLEQGALDCVSEIVAGRDFFREQHRLIFEAMLAVHRDGADVDAITLSTELSRVGRWSVCGGAAYIDQLEEIVPRAGHPETYARRIAELARRRDAAILGLAVSSVANDASASREQVAIAVDALRSGWECGGLELPSMTAAEIDRIEWPERTEWLIAGWWSSEACGFLAGHEKSSKTILAIGMGLCIATGTRWLGKWDVQQGPVVAVLEEDHKRRVQRRLRVVGNALGLDWRTDRLVIAAQEGCNIRDERGRGRLAALVRRVKPVLLIVDPWRRVTPGVDEKDSEKVSEILGWLRRVQVEQHTAVMVLDHMRKEPQDGSDQGRVAHRIRGSGDKGAWYDSLIAVRRKDDDSPEHKVRALHRDATPLTEQMLMVDWDDAAGTVAFNCSPVPPPAAKPTPPKSRVERPREEQRSCW